MNRPRVELAVQVFEDLKGCKLKTGWNIPPLDMQFHIKKGAMPKTDTLDMRLWGTVGECGTVACLAGWLVLDPRIQAEGLMPERESERDISTLRPTYKGYAGLDALEEFFDASDGAIEHVFGHENENDLQAGIDRLRGFLE